MQGGAGKHSGESEAYTNLAGGWKGTLPVRGERQGKLECRNCGRAPVPSLNVAGQAQLLAGANSWWGVILKQGGQHF